MKHSKQMSESIRLGIVLAIAGGFMDAYSYMCRDEVFANAQTGNMLLLGIHVSQREWGLAAHYLFPVVAFAIGIALAEVIRHISNEEGLFHWRQFSVLIEAIVLMGVSFISQDMNTLANSLTSFACGIQVESFRKIHGNGIATTMCIGNLRSATQNLTDYLRTKKKGSLYKSFLYYGVILCFVMGAVIGNQFVQIMKERAILICSAVLFVAFIMMFVDREKQEHERKKIN